MKFKHCFQRAAAALALCVLCMPIAALAAENDAPARAGYRQLTDGEMSSECSITLRYTTLNTENPQPLPQTEFRLYKVADMNSNVQFTVTDDFSEYPVFTPAGDEFVKINELSSDEWSSLAYTLAGYVSRDSEDLTPAASVTTDEAGAAVIKDLSVGLYLMVGDRSTVGRTTYTPTPVLVALPLWTTNSDWEFAVTSNVKYTEYTQPSPGPGPSSSTIERHVLKIWNDEGSEDARPSEIVVELLRDGEVYDTATLNEGNDWRTTWTNLSSSYQWQVTERLDSEDYTVSISQQGSTFTVTNTYVEDILEEGPPLDETPDLPNPVDPADPSDPGVDIDDPDVPTTSVDDPGDPGIDIDDPDIPLSDGTLPQTGQLWWPVPLLAAAGAVMILAGVLRRRNVSLSV